MTISHADGGTLRAGEVTVMSPGRADASVNGTVLVRGFDCLDGTPLIDLKRDRSSYSPLAPDKTWPSRGDTRT